MKITDIKGTVKLNNGIDMPYFGLGVFETKDGEEVIQSILYAIEAGYIHIDTASLYGNEKGVGEAIKQSKLKRNDIFVTSKVWNSDQGYQNTIEAFYRSLDKLGFDYLDLYLVHWPVKNRYKETWKALEFLYYKKLVRAIGISNFLKHQIEDLKETAEIIPMVNQMEFHPYLVQQELIDYCKENSIRYQAWSPLMKGQILKNDVLVKLSAKYGKTAAQIILRWDLQKEVITIPKSVRKERIIENADIFDFELVTEDIKLIDSMDKNYRIGADPDNFSF
jgi:diketogulonate reductase-like aldo/keto reductase